jgi:hypothetical protein
MKPAVDRARNVFINCPFDKRYRPLLDAIVFCIMDCGFVARCALEISDSSQVRIEKIFEIMAECRFSIHDLSRTQTDRLHRLPRFNMPLELGMFLGMKRFGGNVHGKSRCLIFDVEKYRYQKFISDIAGQDIRCHAGNPRTSIGEIRAWLRSAADTHQLPGGQEIFRRYLLFQKHLPAICKKLKIKPTEMNFRDRTTIIYNWILEKNAIDAPPPARHSRVSSRLGHPAHVA